MATSRQPAVDVEIELARLAMNVSEDLADTGTEARKRRATIADQSRPSIDSRRTDEPGSPRRILESMTGTTASLDTAAMSAEPDSMDTDTSASAQHRTDSKDAAGTEDEKSGSKAFSAIPDSQNLYQWYNQNDMRMVLSNAFQQLRNAAKAQATPELVERSGQITK